MTDTQTPEIIASLILTLLPEDGTAVANRILRTMVARRLEARVNADIYFAAIDLLTQADRVGRARGRGGSIFLAERAAVASHVSEASSKENKNGWSEARLMVPVKRFLEKGFPQSLDLPLGSTAIVADISSLGPRSGQWARPDFVLISVMPFQLMPGRQVDVHSFELKAEYGGTMQAVHEALAQTRFTHFGHLIWHVPQGSKTEVRVPEIEDQCAAHGLGLILIRDPLLPETWEIILDPIIKPTTTATVDAFLVSRLPPVHRAKLLQSINGPSDVR